MMSAPRVIIAAAGQGRRWGMHLGVPKHLAPVAGEPVIGRTIRLLHEHGLSPTVMLRPEWEHFYDAHLPLGCSYDKYFPPAHTTGGASGFMLNSMPLWNHYGRTVILCGDVFFTTAAIRRIVKDDQLFNVYLRPGGSQLNGNPRHEAFGFSFYPAFAAKIPEAILSLVSPTAPVSTLYELKALRVWARILGIDFTAQTLTSDLAPQIAKTCMVIDDWTDDFDKPKIYERFLTTFHLAHGTP